MPKQVISTLFLILLFCNSFAEQKNIIDKKTFNILVDYVNCKYAIDFISIEGPEIKNKESKAYIKDFNKYKAAWNRSVKSYQDINIRIEPSIPNSTSIFKAISRSAKGYEKAKALWLFIDSKKNNFKDNWTKSQMIDHLILLPNDSKIPSTNRTFKKVLSRTKELLKPDLESQLNPFEESNNSQEIQASVVKKSEISVEKTIQNVILKDTSLTIGKTKKLAVVIIPSTASFENISWKIVNGKDNIEEEKKEGKELTIKALKEGKSTIEVAVDDNVATCEITVRGQSRHGGYILGLLILICLVSITIWFKIKIWHKGIWSSIVNIFGKNNPKGKNQRKKVTTKENKADEERIKELSREIANLKTESKKYKIENEALRNKKTKLTITRLKSLIEEQVLLDQDFANYIKLLASKINVLPSRKTESLLNTPNTIKTVESKKDPSTNSNSLYAEAINDKELYGISSLPTDLSVFELERTSASTAIFKVFAEAEKRVVARPGNLEGCDTDIVQGGRILQTVAMGKAREVGGKWIVETPLKVKII